MLATAMSESTQPPPSEVLNGFGLLLVDDHPLFRDSFVMALRQIAPLAEAVAVPDITMAKQLLDAQPERFDLVLVDYKMPGVNGLARAIELRKDYGLVSVGLISGEDHPTLPTQARASGLVTCLSKSLEMDDLMLALCTLAKGNAFFPDRPFIPSTLPSANDFGLTARQIEVLRLLATGASNKEIAQTLDISPATVKNHLDAIFERMGVTNRMQAVVLARTLIP